MLDQLLYLEALLKFSFGLALALFPFAAARLAGLPAQGSTFFIRLLGLLLIGLAIAIAIEGAGRGDNPQGLGAHGLAAINLTGICGLLGQLWFGRDSLQARAKYLLAALAALLAIFSLIELIAA